MIGGRGDVGARQLDDVERTAWLVTRARAGERDALERLVADHLALVYSVVRRSLPGSSDADDVVQETLLRAVRSLGTLDDPARFRSWLVSIAYRQVQEHLRRTARRPVPRDPGADTWALLRDPGPDLASDAVARLVLSRQRRDVGAATRWVDESARSVLALWWLEQDGELSREDVARALGVDARHAAVRLQRMRAQVDVARGVVLALGESPRCAGLEVVTRTWDGTPSPLWRKRVHRHVRGCDACRAPAEGLVPLDRLAVGAGVLPVPPLVAASVPGLLDAAGAPGVPDAPSAVAQWWASWSTWEESARQGWGALVARPVAALGAAAVAATGVVVAVTTVVGTQVPDAATAPAPVSAPAPSATPPTAPSPTPAVTPSDPPSPAGTQAAAVSTAGIGTADLYVAPDGSDEGDGTLESPFASIGHAVSVVRPGQAIAVRGGTYRPSERLRLTTDGTEQAPITLSGYRDERAVLDLGGVAGDGFPLAQEADHWTVQALEITGSRNHGYVCESCVGAVFRDLSVHGNVRSGMLLRGEGTVGNQVLDSEFFDNHDDASGGDVGIGLGIKFGSGEGNVVSGNRFYDNADDGVDLGEFTSPVTLRGNDSSGNGVNRWGVADWHGNGGGFTLGGGRDPAAVAHVLEGNTARGNHHHGFADGGNPGALLLTGNVASGNGAAGFSLPEASAVLRENTEDDNGREVGLGAGADSSGNSWDGGGATP